QLGPIVSAYAYSATASVDDKLASEICSALEGVSGVSLPMYALLSGGIDELNSSVPQLFYQRLASSASTEQQVFGLSGRIRSGDTAALTAAAQIASAVTGGQAQGVLLLSVREYLRPTDPTSVKAVGQVATDSALPTALREAAAHVLAAVHTAAALPLLATLLDDPDLNLQVEAVGGMGSFANGLPVRTRQSAVTLAYLQLPANAPYKTQDTVANFALGQAANETSYIYFGKTGGQRTGPAWDIEDIDCIASRGGRPLRICILPRFSPSGNCSRVNSRTSRWWTIHLSRRLPRNRQAIRTSSRSDPESSQPP